MRNQLRDRQAPQFLTEFADVGDKVWLEGCNLTTTHPTTKLAPQHYRPFPITCVMSRTSYQLKLPPQWKIHNVFHTTLLTPYKETPLNSNQNQEPTPKLVDGQPEWEVEQILCVRQHQRQVQYLIRWKGFSKAHDSWEPATNVHTEELIKEFYKDTQKPSDTSPLNPLPSSYVPQPCLPWQTLLFPWPRELTVPCNHYPWLNVWEAPLHHLTRPLPFWSTHSASSPRR